MRFILFGLRCGEKITVGIRYALLNVKNCMKQNLIIYGVLAAGVAVVGYLLKRRKTTPMVEQQPLQHSRHLTDGFAKARQSNLPAM